MSLVRKQFSIGETSAFECWIYVIRYADGRPDEFWFKGNDVAEFLEYARPHKAIADHVDEVWRRNWSVLRSTADQDHLSNTQDPHVTSPQDDVITPPNWQPHTVFISEPGLYALVTRSKKPEAVRFTKWVYEEVLPSLRRIGSFSTSNSGPSTSDSGVVESTTVAAAAAASLQKDLELQRMANRLQASEYERKLQESARKLETLKSETDREMLTIRAEADRKVQVSESSRVLFEQQQSASAREAQLMLEKENLELHYRYAFQTSSARELGRAAIEQYVQRKAAENANKMIKTEIAGKYRLIRNMDDINPLKVNHLGIVYNRRTSECQIIRQQYGTTLKTYDYIQKSSGSQLERLEPDKHKRRLNDDCYVLGELIAVAHGVNIWTNFLTLRVPQLFGLMFSPTTWNKFTVMREPQLRLHYQNALKLCGGGDDVCVDEPRPYSEKLCAFYKTLMLDLRFVDENDCVTRCLLSTTDGDGGDGVDGVWQLRQQLLDYVQTNTYDFIETAAVSATRPGAAASLLPTVDDLLNEPMEARDAEALDDVGRRFPEDVETLRLRTICERRRLIEPSHTARNFQQLAVDIATAETGTTIVGGEPSVGGERTSTEYTVQVPQTPRPTTADQYSRYVAAEDAMSIVSVETATSDTHVSRYFSDLFGVRQTSVDKYTK